MKTIRIRVEDKTTIQVPRMHLQYGGRWTTSKTPEGRSATFRVLGLSVFLLFFHVCDFSHVFFVLFCFCFLDFLFIFLDFLFIVLDFLFCFFEDSLHSGRSKVTHVTVGRDTNQPKFSSL